MLFDLCCLSTFYYCCVLSLQFFQNCQWVHGDNIIPFVYSAGCKEWNICFGARPHSGLLRGFSWNYGCFLHTLSWDRWGLEAKSIIQSIFVWGARYVSVVFCSNLFFQLLFISPRHLSHIYSENLVHLPHCYFVNDYKQFCFLIGSFRRLLCLDVSCLYWIVLFFWLMWFLFEL